MATNENPIKEAAYAYAARGYRLVELHTSKNGCCSCGKAFNCSSKGKHPRQPEWQLAEKPSGADIETLFGGDRPANIGIATGPESGIFVVDVDGERGNETMKGHAEAGRILTPTYTVKTGSGGWHFYYAYPDFEVGNSASTKVGLGVDTRGKGGYVVAPPSVSDKGPYKTTKDIAVAEAPEWLLELLRPKERVAPTYEPKELLDMPAAERQRLDGYTAGALQNELDRLDRLHWAGDPAEYRGEPWDHTVFEVACNLIQLANASWSNLSINDAHSWLDFHAPRDPGFDDARVDAKWESALKKVGDQQATYPPKPLSIDFLLGEQPQELSNDNSSGNAVQNVSNPVVTDPFDALVAESDAAGPPPPPPRVEIDYMVGDTPIRQDFDGFRLDPDYVVKAKAEALRAHYSSKAAIEVTSEAAFIPPVADLVKPMASIPENQADDLAPVSDWIRRSLRSGSPDLLWAALCAVLSGVDTDGPTIVFKGGAPILALLARTLTPAVGEDGETMLLGPRVSTREVEGPQIVFEFDDTETIDLLPHAAAIEKHALAHPGVLVEPDADTHEELAALEDYRAAQLHRARLGLGSRPRVDGDD